MHHTIGVIGGGFSGASVAIQLARHGPKDLLVYVIERRDSVGRGMAYGTRNPSHLLNVPAKRMSLFADDPDHFVRWLRSEGEPFTPDDFVPRSLYGRYVEASFENPTDAATGPSIRHVQGEAVSVRPSGQRQRILLASGREIDVDHVVLATGHFPPGHPSGIPPEVHGHPAYASDPWSSDALEGLASEDSVLIVGTGLTAIDLTLSILETNPAVQVTLLSVTGKFPQVHAPTSTHEFSQPLPRTLRQLVKFIRKEIRSSNGDWRGVLDAIRPHSGDLWTGFSTSDKTQFLEHVRPIFERFRHRMAPEIESNIEGLVASSAVAVIRGRILSARPGEMALVCTMSLEDGSLLETEFQRVVNCTGPLCDYRRMQHPLIKSLIRSGIIRPDQFHLGIDATPEGQVRDAEGKPQSWLSTLGPTLKGTLWETTAVPEIREQAQRLAKRILAG